MRPAASKSLTESWLGTALPPAASISLQTCGGGVLPGALTAEGDAHVVDHHLGALRGEAEGDVPPDAPSSTRHHRRSTVEKSHARAVARRRYLTDVSGIAPGCTLRATTGDEVVP